MPVFSLLNRTLKLVLAILFFFGGPFFIIDYQMGILAQRQTEYRRQELYRRLDQRLESVQPYSNIDWVLRRKLLAVVRRAESAHDWKASLLADAKLLTSRYPRAFSMCVLDAKDRAVWVSEATISRTIASQLSTYLKQFFRDPSASPRIEDQNAFRSYIGATRRFLRLENGTCWLQTSNMPRRTWFFYYLSGQFTILVNIHREGLRPYEFLKEHVRRTSAGDRVYLYDAVEERVWPKNPSADADARMVGRLFDRETDNHYEMGDRVWAVLSLNHQFRLIANMSSAEIYQPLKMRSDLRNIMLLLILGLAFVVYQYIRFGVEPYISLKIKLTTMMAIISGIPLLLLIILSHYVYIEQQKYSEDRVRENLRLHLLHLDGKVDIAVRNGKKEFLRILKETDLTSESSCLLFHQKFSHLQARYGFNSVKIYDTSGNMITYGLPSAGLMPDAQFVKAIIGEILDRIAPGHRRTSSPADQTFQIVDLASEVGPNVVDDAVGHIGEFFSHTINQWKYYLLFEVIRHAGTLEPTHVAFLIWEQVRLVRHCMRFFVSDDPTQRTAKVFIINNCFTRYTPSEKVLRNPYRLPYTERLIVSPSTGPSIMPALLARCKRNNRFVCQAYLAPDASQWLLAIQPGDKLFNTYIAAAAPLSSGASSADIRSTLAFFALFILFYSSLIGWFFSQQVITPLDQIRLGIDAVQNSQFSFRMAISQKNELGQLANHFNTMMEQMSELSVARMVQKSLFPQRVQAAGPYRVHGVTVPATTLGGDYYDFRRLNERGFIVLLGDASGHGVPAAIIISMAKAVLSALITEPEDIEPSLIRLNNVLNTEIAGRLPHTMTLCLCHVDATTQEIRIFNCGHPYPLLIDRRGIIHNIETTGTPLGIRRPVVSPHSLVLEPGERLVLFTDGLVESYPEATRTGVDAFLLWEQHISKYTNIPFDGFCREVLASHPVQNLVPLPDDYSLVVIERDRA
ncbi:MAG TPA: SpoIIE family protein phosphatase [Candidatus Ozemobacteraceae bacterium]|nr:SpoIIE family protein phosphatase [Candidatus Ozemobacteraceae bacterium]